MNSGVESARVHPDKPEAESTLFQLSDFSRPPLSPRQLCDDIKLNWLAAMRLFESGWLSFDPAATPTMNPAQKAELGFLGGLVVGGCEESMLGHLLAGLVKPYAYRLDRVYYDWESQCWQLSSDTLESKAQFEGWVEQLVDSGQLSTLESLRSILDRSITDLRRLRNW